MRSVKTGPIYGRSEGNPYQILVLRASDEEFENFYSFEHGPVISIPLLVSAHARVGINARRMRALDDGTQMSHYVWVRVQMDRKSAHNGVHSYTLFANGLSPKENLVSEVIGIEYTEGASLDEIPQCIADAVRLMLIRGRSTSTAMVSHNTIWFYELPLTTDDLMEITRRDKWAFEGCGQTVFKDLMGVLSAKESTEVSA